MQIELRWFIDRALGYIAMRLASTSSSSTSIPDSAAASPLALLPRPVSPSPLPLLVHGVRRQCDMQYGNHRACAPGPTWMLDLVEQPLNRLPGTYGKGSTTSQ